MQDQARSMVGYGQIAMNYMEEVYLTFDKEDPKVAHITAVVNDDEVARYYFTAIPMKIKALELLSIYTPVRTAVKATSTSSSRAE